ncbi:hypothetical protein BJV78DRAFT_1264286 [Lactifluus subvellereus]|nr:hypothetical protein BJV78DRAFT_1264286 [Lactifluus subvellereus]
MKHARRRLVHKEWSQARCVKACTTTSGTHDCQLLMHLPFSRRHWRITDFYLYLYTQGRASLIDRAPSILRIGSSPSHR